MNTTQYKRAPGFTLIELMLVVALLGTLAVLGLPRLFWTDSPKRTLQRSVLEAIDTAQQGIAVRMRCVAADRGRIMPQFLPSGANSRTGWVGFKMERPPEGNEWTVQPEIIYFFNDGTCTPGKIIWGKPPGETTYLLTVTGYIVEQGSAAY